MGSPASTLVEWPFNYVAAWIVMCVAAVVTALKHRRALAERYRGYVVFLCAPWKLVTFSIALAGITLIAPYTGDVYWDYTVAAIMALGSFATAPWALAVITRFVRRRASGIDLFLALCAWLFTASWSYDGYNLLRFGEYPTTWAINLPASSILYVLAGVFWSLDHCNGRPAIAFLSDDWPVPSADGAFVRLLPWAAPIMLLVGYLIVGFVFGWLG